MAPARRARAPALARPAALGDDLQPALAAAGLRGLTFHGLRHTAATRLAEARCTAAEIANLERTDREP